MKSTPSGNSALMASAVSPLMPATSVTIVPSKASLCPPKANHDGCRRTEIIILARRKAVLPRRIHLVDHPSAWLLKGLFIGIDSDDMLVPMRRRPRAKEPPMRPSPMMATVSFVLNH